MKKILIAANTSWFIYNFLRPILFELHSAGYNLILVAPKDDYSGKLQALGYDYIELKLDRSGANLFNELKSLVRFISIYRKVKPSCILNFTPKVNIYSTLAGKLLRVPVINSVAGLGSIFTEKGIKSRLGKFLLKLTQPLAKHTVFQNNDDWSIYIKHSFISKEKSSKVNGLGIDLTEFTPWQREEDNSISFILFARMLKNKGVVEFVEAARIVRKSLSNGERSDVKLKFSLLGFVDTDNPQGIYSSQLEFWHKEGVVDYLGKTDRVYEVVKQYDCVVLPSYYREGMPQCLIEAAAMAKPIITTDNVGCRDIVEHDKTGYLVKPKSVESLASAMFKFIDLSYESRMAMGKKGREKAETDFSHIHVAKHYLCIINCISSDLI